MAADLFFFLSPVVLRNWFTGLTAMSITHSRVVLMFLFPPSRPAYILNVKPLFFFIWSKEKAWNFILWKCYRGRTDTYVRVANPNSVVKKKTPKKVVLGDENQFCNKQQSWAARWIKSVVTADCLQQSRSTIVDGFKASRTRLMSTAPWYWRHAWEVKPKKDRIFTVSNSDSRNWEGCVKDVRR